MDNLFPQDRIKPELHYYSITLLADQSGRTWIDGQTSWAGFADNDPRVELRQLCRVIPERMVQYWEESKQPYIIVNTTRDFYQFIISGGHALVCGEMMKMHLPKELEPSKTVREGLIGFTALSKLPKGALNRAPTPKVRMKVLKRDGYRCKICGRRPADYTDIEIHLHHIRPYGKYGVSTEKNLISLCHTCHKGLDPHYEFSLYSLLDPEMEVFGGDSISNSLQKYIDGVNHHRKAVRKIFSEVKENSANQSGDDNSE